MNCPSNDNLARSVLVHWAADGTFRLKKNGMDGWQRGKKSNIMCLGEVLDSFRAPWHRLYESLELYGRDELCSSKWYSLSWCFNDGGGEGCPTRSIWFKSFSSSSDDLHGCGWGHPEWDCTQKSFQEIKGGPWLELAEDKWTLCLSSECGREKSTSFLSRDWRG